MVQKNEIALDQTGSQRHPPLLCQRGKETSDLGREMFGCTLRDPKRIYSNNASSFRDMGILVSLNSGRWKWRYAKPECEKS